MKMKISDKQYLSELTAEQSDKIKQVLTFKNPKYSEALRFNRSVWNISKTIELYQETEDCLIIRNGPAAPHGLPDLILASSQFSMRICNENTRTLAAACGSLA